jgi:hypothetical protein
MVEGLHICARDLVLAVFRLAVADYLGVAYGHDEAGPNKCARINPEVQSEAAAFLTSQWATHLGELAGFSAHTVWKSAQPERLLENDLRRAA